MWRTILELLRDFIQAIIDFMNKWVEKYPWMSKVISVLVLILTIILALLGAGII